MLATGIVLGAPAPARADGGHGGAASDYRIEIVAISGPADGIDLDVIELGDRLELRRDGASEVVVLGYEGEPYLRLDSDGVFENVRSPAVYLNRDRFATTTPPSSADASAPAEWNKVADGDVARWHDHRAHWMASIPPQQAQDEPGREHVAKTDEVQLLVDGARVAVTVRVTWVPPPARTAWWAAAVAAAAAVGVVLSRRRTAAAGGLVLLAGVGGFALADVPTLPRALIAAGLAVMAVAVVRVRRPDALALAGAVVMALGLTRLTVFDHPVLAGRVDASVMRVGLAVCLAASGAAVIAGLVESFRPTRPSREPAAR